MECPKCHSEMAQVGEQQHAALKCAGCGGMWFRNGAHELAKNSEVARDIDAETDAATASRMNSVRDIDCPDCAQRMIKMVDRQQLHIQYEACPDCNSVVFDSGEFQDYTDFTFLERVAQVIDTVKTNLKS